MTQPTKQPTRSGAARRRQLRTPAAGPLRAEHAAAKAGVLGVPFDANSSFRRGPAKAPAAIRAALGSDSGNAWSERGLRIWPSDAVLDHGDLSIPGDTASKAPIDAIERGVTTALTATPRLLVFGGDHAISYPVMRAFAARYGRLSLLHFDAHPDLYPDFGGNRYSHASPMARILEEGLVDRLVQVGIRSYTPAQQEIATRYGVEVYPAWGPRPLPVLCFASPLYVSIDLDGLDPAFAPGVSHPEPGGLSTREVLDVLAAVQAPALVGADIVELNPDCDPTGLTATVAAKLARELLARLLTP